MPKALVIIVSSDRVENLKIPNTGLKLSKTGLVSEVVCVENLKIPNTGLKLLGKSSRSKRKSVENLKIPNTGLKQGIIAKTTIPTVFVENLKIPNTGLKLVTFSFVAGNPSASKTSKSQTRD